MSARGYLHNVIRDGKGCTPLAGTCGLAARTVAHILARLITDWTRPRSKTGANERQCRFSFDGVVFSAASPLYNQTCCPCFHRVNHWEPAITG